MAKMPASTSRWLIQTPHSDPPQDYFGGIIRSITNAFEVRNSLRYPRQFFCLFAGGRQPVLADVNRRGCVAVHSRNRPQCIVNDLQIDDFVQLPAHLRRRQRKPE